MTSDILRAAATADAAHRIRTSGRPYAFTTVPGHILPQPVGGIFCHQPAAAFELSNRERLALAAENDQPWSRPYIIAERYGRAARGGDAGWGS